MTTHQDVVETLAAERYLLGEMSEAERHRFEEHFFTCEECAEDMRLGSRLQNDAKAIFPSGRFSVPSSGATVLSWRRRATVAMPWAAAASLALALVYQANIPRIEDEARALAPVALRPATRGAVPTVTLPDKGGVLALALDVNTGVPGDNVTYRLQREDGTGMASGSTTVPASGTPLLLLVPADRLGDGGSFVLTLTAAASTSPPSEYRFNAAAR
jgi:anti-sigma factor RsiW